ncbi:DUF5677 domain-containing protein [Acaryochloris marina NIES-2412]|uniref:DUF5677 domain-containing protein n=1 Tax=Acaryochloris marina TaxID=155978 RepID=UPI0040590800
MDAEVVKSILEGLAPVIERVRSGQMTHDGLYVCILKAAFAKNYEFNQLVYRAEAPHNQFVFNPSLRGLCKDIIGLKFLGTFSDADRDEAALLLVNEQTNSFIQKQQDFFSTHRPTQRILGNNSLNPDADAGQESQAIRRRLAQFRATYQWTSRRDWPTIREMADTTGLTTLYDYLYAITSSFVHFSPRNLARMGWGDIKTQTFDYSTYNFASYYDAFSRFYSLFLLVTFSTTFATTLGCRSDLQEFVDQLIEILNDEEHWPELVTFEEMNWFDKRPSQILVSPFGITGNDDAVPQPPAYWQWA